VLTRDGAGASATQPALPRTERSRARRMLPPVAAGLGVLAATMFIRTVDPHVPGVYPPCPTQALLGLDCPGCGGLRATYCLAHGDIAGALDHNLLFVVLVPVLIAGWGVWMYTAWTGRQPWSDRTRDTMVRVLPVALVIAFTAYTIVRNFVPYLGSGVG